MKWARFLMSTILGLFVASVCLSQEPQVCISQTAANRCASAAQELIEARNTINEFLKERATSIAEREAAAKVIAGLNDLVAVKDRVIASYEQINALYKSVIDLQAQVITRLEERLARPKSAFQRFVDALKTIGYIAAGIALGRGL